MSEVGFELTPPFGTQKFSMSHKRKGAGASKFLGVRKLFPEFYQTCPKHFCATFAYKFSPTKIMKTFFGVTSKNRFSCVFLQTLGAIFWSATQLGAIFARIFRDFAQTFRDFVRIFKDVAKIFRYFAQIFNESKLLGLCLQPPHPCLLHHCINTSRSSPWRSRWKCTKCCWKI